MKEWSTLKRIYFNPEHFAGFSNTTKLKKASGISVPKIRAFLETQDSYTYHKPVRKRYPTRFYHVTNIDDVWEADLNVLPSIKAHNTPYAYILTVIDVFSKYAWARALKSKAAPDLVSAFSKIFSERVPRVLQTDKGTEFTNRTFREFLSKHGVSHYTTSSNVKASVVERFNRTLKTKMWKYFTHTNSYRYVDVLPALVKAYNSSYHRSIKMAPADVNEYNVLQVYKNLYAGRCKVEQKKTRSPMFKVGDYVRISAHKMKFDKGYEQNWTEEIFQISKVVRGIPAIYKLKDLAGEPIEGLFYTEELQRVALPQTYKVDKILQSKGRGRSRQVLVKWRGYPAKFNSWVKASSVVSK